jgi:oxygen-dependent protoporphyrinogen oxidase
MTSAQRVIVVGAGMAGLTAAHFLKEAGTDVVVVEQDTRPGGRIRSVRKGDDTIDVGAQFIHTNYKVTLELCKKFDLQSDLVEMRTDDMMMRGGQAHIIPWGSIRVPTISLWSRFKTIRQLSPLIRRRKEMALDRWPQLLDLDKLELATYARLKLNEELLEYTVRPLMLTYSMSEPEGISLAYYLRSAYVYTTTGAHCFRSGNDTLPKALAQGLDIRLGNAVTSLLCTSGGRVCGVRTSDGEIEGSAVIAAIPSPALLPLHSDWDVQQREFLQSFEFAQMPLVVFEGDIRKEVTYWGGVLDRAAEHRISFLTYPHMKYAGACKPRYLLAWPLGSFGRELIELSDEAIIEAVAEELRRASPADADSIESASVFRHRHTYPQYKVGTFEKLLRFKASEGRPAGLYFAGDYTEGGLIEGAAHSGYKAAQRVTEDLSPS